MLYTQEFKSIEGIKVTTTYTTPKECPLCHSAIEPVIYGGSIDGEKHVAYLTLHCGCRNCYNSFLAKYRILNFSFDDYPRVNYDTSFIRSEPKYFVKIKFDEKIELVSPSFVEIYNQSKIAEEKNLTHLCGIGYRKSLEFLIKDFAIYLNPDDKDEIISKSLAKCINDYIENKKLKTVATAAAWIGNDETHYIKKHQDYNLKDLKNFIVATVSYIITELTALDSYNLIASQD